MGFFDFLKKQSKQNVDQTNQMVDVDMAKDDTSAADVSTDDTSSTDSFDSDM